MLLHQLGLLMSFIGVIVSGYYSRPKIQVLEKNKFNLEYQANSSEFTAPLDSELRVKFNGNGSRKMICALDNIKKPSSLMYQWKYIPATKEAKSNSTLKYPLQKNETYRLHIEPFGMHIGLPGSQPPFVPFIVEYSILEINKRSPEMFQIGLTLFTTGFVIYFAS